jgi:hypothetical protein
LSCPAKAEHPVIDTSKLWNGLTPGQQGWVQVAADEVNKTQPAKAN